MLFEVTQLGTLEEAVLEQIRDQWRRLKWLLGRKPSGWIGLLRQSAQAKGIRGSNSIEGYEVSEDDASAIVEGDTPFDSDAAGASWAAVQGYQEAMTHALRQAADPDARIDLTLLRSLHFMMLKHEPTKHPGSWRPGPAHDGRFDRVVYEAPDRALVPGLMDELVSSLRERRDLSNLVLAALAHLNLAMIHPFSDGNGRMARCLQTLVLAQGGLFDPVFCSIEEWLGQRRNTDEYYEMLAEVGAGAWTPGNDTRPWVRFMLKAHYQQAFTFERRQEEMGRLWDAMERLLEQMSLPDRAVAPLVEAALGRSLRNSRYRYHTEVAKETASRDLKLLVDAGLLVNYGKKRGSYYRAAERLSRVRDELRVSKIAPNPFDEATPPA